VCAQQFEHLVRDVLAGAGCDTDAIGGMLAAAWAAASSIDPIALAWRHASCNNFTTRGSDRAAGPSPAPLLVSSAGTASGAGGVAPMTTSASNSVEEALA